MERPDVEDLESKGRAYIGLAEGSLRPVWDWIEEMENFVIWVAKTDDFQPNITLRVIQEKARAYAKQIPH